MYVICVFLCCCVSGRVVEVLLFYHVYRSRASTESKSIHMVGKWGRMIACHLRKQAKKDLYVYMLCIHQFLIRTLCKSVLLFVFCFFFCFFWSLAFFLVMRRTHGEEIKKKNNRYKQENQCLLYSRLFFLKRSR